jgi:hypothetical protein
MMWNMSNLRNPIPTTPSAQTPQQQQARDEWQAFEDRLNLPWELDTAADSEPQTKAEKPKHVAPGASQSHVQPIAHGPLPKALGVNPAVQKALRQRMSTATRGGTGMTPEYRALRELKASAKSPSSFDAGMLNQLRHAGLVQLRKSRYCDPATDQPYAGVEITQAGRERLRHMEMARTPVPTNPLSSRSTKLRDPALLELATFRSGQDPATLAHYEELEGTGLITADASGRMVLTGKGGAYLNSQQVRFRLQSLRSPKRM